MVSLAEAWDSGALTWTTATRQAFANDLGDSRALALRSAASSCTDSTITITRAR
jgi:hypothetical protein